MIKFFKKSPKSNEEFMSKLEFVEKLQNVAKLCINSTTNIKALQALYKNVEDDLKKQKEDYHLKKAFLELYKDPRFPKCSESELAYKKTIGIIKCYEEMLELSDLVKKRIKELGGKNE